MSLVLVVFASASAWRGVLGRTWHTVGMGALGKMHYWVLSKQGTVM
jgi:hypothetical protein